jgi:hypothetical protein
MYYKQIKLILLLVVMCGIEICGCDVRKKNISVDEIVNEYMQGRISRNDFRADLISRGASVIYDIIPCLAYEKTRFDVMHVVCILKDRRDLLHPMLWDVPVSSEKEKSKVYTTVADAIYADRYVIDKMIKAGNEEKAIEELRRQCKARK